MSKKILIIEDDSDMSQLLKKFLTTHGYDVETALNGMKGISFFQKSPTDIVLCDFRLGDIDGIEVLKQIKNLNPHVPFIIITGYSDIRVAVNVMKMGAFDYLTKPLIPEEMLQIIKRASALPDPTITSIIDSKITAPNYSDMAVIGDYVFSNNAQSKELFKQIELVAPTNYSVIIYGESGVGKEAVAQTIHRKSKRANAPFTAMDCGAISKDLAGSELFGHEKGAFTGALATKIGHFEMANGGTIFLDEISNLPYDVQSSLLRVIQERKVKRIGGTKEIPFDVRIIIASNENLSDCYKKGKFREDLYHRFNEFTVTLPPLRERKEDIMFYAHFFLKIANKELNKNLEGFEEEVVNRFMNYSWYGNLREMKNIIRRAALLSDGKKIEVTSLPFEFSNYVKTTVPVAIETPPSSSNIVMNTGLMKEKEEKPDLKSAALEAEYELILKVLKQSNFNKSKAAKILNVNRKTLYNKMKSFNLEQLH